MSEGRAIEMVGGKDVARRLVLVKHSLPEVHAAADSADWVLSAEGVRRCEALAEALGGYMPAEMYCSAEPKAERTARLVGARLGIRPTVAPGLHEHDRRGTPLVGQEAFEHTVAQFFARPQEVVYGNESAHAALARFGGALDGILAHQPMGNLIVVAHGTVIALYVERHTGLAALDLWQRLQCPSFVVLSLPAPRVELVADRIG